MRVRITPPATVGEAIALEQQLREMADAIAGARRLAATTRHKPGHAFDNFLIDVELILERAAS